MDYRKMVNNKKKVIATIEGIKKFATDKKEEVKNYTGNTVEDLKTNVKNTTKDIKDNISSSIQVKLTNEFRKNYPIYALSFVDDFIINSFSDNAIAIVISKYVEENTLSIKSIIDEIASGMINDELKETYVSDDIINILFDYLATYYKGEKQLDVVVTDTTITISLKTEPVKDTETDVENSDNVEETTSNDESESIQINIEK